MYIIYIPNKYNNNNESKNSTYAQNKAKSILHVIHTAIINNNTKI